MKKMIIAVFLLMFMASTMVFAQPAPRPKYWAEVQITYYTATIRGSDRQIFIPGKTEYGKVYVLAADEADAERVARKEKPGGDRYVFERWLTKAESQQQEQQEQLKKKEEQQKKQAEQQRQAELQRQAQQREAEQQRQAEQKRQKEQKELEELMPDISKFLGTWHSAADRSNPAETIIITVNRIDIMNSNNEHLYRDLISRWERISSKHRDYPLGFYIGNDFVQSIKDVRMDMNARGNDYIIRRPSSEIYLHQNGQSLIYGRTYTKVTGQQASTAQSQQKPQQAPQQTQTAQQRYDKGVGFYNNKNYDSAITEFTEAIRLAPNNAHYYAWRGYTYYEKGDNDRAIADYTEAIRLGQNSANNYITRGHAYYRKKDWNRAIADYEAALRLEPNNANAKTSLENARKARGK